MIKTFAHTINGQRQEFCATVAEGSDVARAMISTKESPETLVIMQADGTLSAIKAKLESTEAMIDDAIRKVQATDLIERALATGEIQTGSL
jgi:hypothetical protein